jgi:hypothetical protein
MEFSKTVPWTGPTPFSLTETDSVWPDTLAPAMPSAADTFSTTLGTSLLADLRRFADEPQGADLLVVLAAGVRHARPLALSLELLGHRFRLAVFPREQVYRCGLDLCALASRELGQLQCVHVEPEAAIADADASTLHASAGAAMPLPPLLWLLATQGPRSELLPEIAGPARYRMAPGLALGGLPIDDASRPVLHKLWCESCSLDDLAGDSVLGRWPACRLLNALYLQSGLMISRAFSTRAPQQSDIRRGRG